METKYLKLNIFLSLVSCIVGKVYKGTYILHEIRDIPLKSVYYDVGNYTLLDCILKSRIVDSCKPWAFKKEEHSKYFGKCYLVDIKRLKNDVSGEYIQVKMSKENDIATQNCSSEMNQANKSSNFGSTTEATSTNNIILSSQEFSSNGLITTSNVETVSNVVTTVISTPLELHRHNFTCIEYFKGYCITFNGRNVSNIALDGEATHIGGRYHVNGTPYKAIDGNMDTFSHTNFLDRMLDPWWEVKLQITAKIYEIVIYPRVWKSVHTRFSNGTLTIRNETEEIGFELAKDMNLYMNLYPKRIECMAIGKLLRIQLFSNTVLHMSEVEIYGKYFEVEATCNVTAANETDNRSCQQYADGQCRTGNGNIVRNLALEGHAEQYPEAHTTHNGIASKSIDGLVDTFSNTVGANNHWLEITLAKSAIIYGIRILTRVSPHESTDHNYRFVNGVLSIKNERANKKSICATNINLFPQKNTVKTVEKTFSLIAVGKLLKITIRKDITTYLHLREVEIYGKYIW